MYRVVGGSDYTERLKREYERVLREQQEQNELVDEQAMSSESDEEPDAVPTQTYPTSSAVSIVRQDGLTCGMCALQNLYGETIVNREDMDTHAKRLEKHSFGETMYDPKLGYYSIEVLKSVLQENGKFVQHVDIDKVPAKFFSDAIMLNPTFQGYIVTLDMPPLKHYIAVRHRQRSYSLLDSLPNAEPQTISNETIFRRREDGHIYCSMNSSDKRKVVSVLAVGNSPFVEYMLLHNTWSDAPFSKKQYLGSIAGILRGNRRVVAERARGAGDYVTSWYKKWMKSRAMPTKNVMQFLKTYLISELKGEMSVVVRISGGDSKEHRTVVKCKTVGGLLRHLKEMQWISEDRPFALQQNGKYLVDEYDETIEWDSDGSFEDYNILPNEPIEIMTEIDTGCMAKIGGFYTFHSKIEGTCIGQQHNAYSVRDAAGNVHVVYKHCIERVTK